MLNRPAYLPIAASESKDLLGNVVRWTLAIIADVLASGRYALEAGIRAISVKTQDQTMIQFLF